MSHSYLTIVAIYGHNDGESAIAAITESMAQLPGSKGLLISVSKPKNLPCEISWRQIFPMNYRQYSLFMMFCLHHFIETDFCLTVQDDGWVLNGKNWSDLFLSYDYLGAPCHAAIVDSELVTHYRWIDEPNPLIIQNGGFSLRSRKYLTSASISGALYHFADAKSLWNEDVQLTGIWRNRLEELGVRIAPDSIAKQFAIEFLGPKLHDDFDFKSLFGFHGWVRKLVGHKTIQYAISEIETLKIHREAEAIAHLRELGYRITFRG